MCSVVIMEQEVGWEENPPRCGSAGEECGVGSQLSFFSQFSISCTMVMFLMQNQFKKVHPID